MPQLNAEEIPELLARLVDKSLVHVDASGRFNLLQLVRSFGQEEIAEMADNAPTRTRHLQHYVDFSSRQALAIIGPRLFEAHEAFAVESENLRQSVEWAITDAHTWPLAVELLNNTFWPNFNRGAMSEGAALCSLVIDNAPATCDPKDLADAWGWLCTYRQLSDHPDAIAICDKAIELGQQSQNPAPIAQGTFQKAMFNLRKGRLEDLQPLLFTALDAIRQVSGPVARQMEFSVLTILGNSAVMGGRLEAAKEFYEECETICDELGYVRGHAVLYGNLGHLYERLGEYKTTHRYMIKSLDTFLKLNDLRNLAGTLSDSASGFWVAEDYETAALAVGCAFGIWGDSELVPDSIDFYGAERWRERLMEKMGAAAFTAAFEKGKTISPKEMVAIILANPEPWAR